MANELVPTEEIDRRNGGCGVIFEDKLYVWGGNGTDIRYPYREMAQQSDSSDDSDSDDSDEEELDPNFQIKTVVTLPRPNDPNHPFDVLDLSTRTWFRQPTSGDYPTLGLGSSLNIHHPSKTFILFSGFKDVQFDCEVYKVSPLTGWVWEMVRVSDNEVKPSERYLTGVIIHNDRMCIFGGVGRSLREIGDPPRPQDPGGRYIAYVENGVALHYGWTNEYFEFLIDSNEWEAPLGSKAFRPEPLGSHAFSKFDSHRAVLFGGNNTLVYSNTCYLFDLDTRVWTGPIRPTGPEQPWPTGTRFSTLTSLLNPERVWQEMYKGCGQILNPRMVLLWGKTNRQLISPETWLLEFNLDHPTEPLVWRRLTIDIHPRSWHIARPVYSDQTTSCDTVIFGGNHYKFPGTGNVERDNAADLKILHFGVSTLEELCLMVVVSNQELMDLSRHANHKTRLAISQAHTCHVNCSLITDITHTLNGVTH